MKGVLPERVEDEVNHVCIAVLYGDMEWRFAVFVWHRGYLWGTFSESANDSTNDIGGAVLYGEVE